MKRALITGVSGQDGSYLAELLLEKDYEVHGLIRRCGADNVIRSAHLAQLKLHFGDLTDAGSIEEALNKSKADEVYNLAAMSHVRVSYDCPVFTGSVTGVGFANVLQACRQLAPKARIY